MKETPLIILDNLIFSLQKAGGISRMWATLIGELCKYDGIQILCMEYPGAQNNICRQELTIPDTLLLTRKHPVPILCERLSSPNPGNYMLQDGTPLSEAMRGRKVIFHSPYYRTMGMPGVINLVTLHDMTHEILRISSLHRRMVHTYIKRKALKHAHRIVCVSETTRDELSQIYPNLIEKCCIVHNGISAPRYDSADDISYTKYLMFVGSRNGYKRFDHAVNIAHSMNLPLLICGSPLSKKEIQMLHGIEYDCRSHATSAAIMQWMHNAYALLYTSEYEGFGLPIIEAQTVNCPVIVSDKLNILPHLCDSVLPVGETSTSSVSNIIEILSRPELRTQQCVSGLDNALKYSADKMARQYLDIYLTTLQ